MLPGSAVNAIDDKDEAGSTDASAKSTRDEKSLEHYCTVMLTLPECVTCCVVGKGVVDKLPAPPQPAAAPAVSTIARPASSQIPRACHRFLIVISGSKSNGSRKRAEVVPGIVSAKTTVTR